MHNYPNLDLVNIIADAKFGQKQAICSQVIEPKIKILISIKGHNCITNWWKLTCNNPNGDLININAYTNLGENPSICSQDTEQNRKFST